MVIRSKRGITMVDTLITASNIQNEHEVETTQTPNTSTGNIDVTSPPESDNPIKKKGRGPAKGPRIDPGKKMEVEWNEYMQPIGVNRSAFMSYLGTLARNGMRLPLTYAKWSNMDQHLVDYVWKEIEYNTNAPPGSRRNCLKSVADMWRDWKSRMKRKYYNGKTKEECLAIVPQEISVEQLKVFVEYWSTNRVEEISEKNKQNRMMLGPLHRTGRKSCANIRREMEEAGKPTDTLSVYIEMRTDLGGNPKDDYAAALIHEFNKKLNDLPMEERNLVEKRDKILMDVLGDEGHGRVRTRGSGPTPSEIYGKKVTSPELDSIYKERLRSEIVQDLSKEFEDKFNSMNSQIEFLKSQLLLSQEQEQTMGASTSHINATTADQVCPMPTNH